jgi:hypothetical protein
MAQPSAFASIAGALKIAVALLRDSGTQFLLGGSLAAWARGAMETQNDLDLMVRPQDAERALAALAAGGMRTERPPEEWLYKAWHDDVLIDIIFQPAGLELDDEVFARADDLSVAAVRTPVMALEDVLVTKLCALDEHSLDYSQLVGIARATREQIDFRSLAARTAHTPYASAFFALVRELGIAPGLGTAESEPTRRVRVVPAAPR